jgi:polyphosphate kinase
VTAVVELKARFDEANNIRWARALEEAGVHVVYGLVGFKIHCKVALVVRADEDRIRRYVHLGTGNYNASTARFYTDLGVLTCRPELGDDVTNLFNLLTGICQFQGTRRLLVAPFQMHDRVVELIDRETGHARDGLPARIVAKMNSMVDTDVIEALYRASRAGVEIDLIVRGICCLRPGVDGMSENIQVRSIIDRFLEHSRVYVFGPDDDAQIFLSSADWMPRNFFRRVELMFPVLAPELSTRILKEILPVYLADNTRARQLDSDGVFHLLHPGAGETPVRCQIQMLEQAGPEVDSFGATVSPSAGSYAAATGLAAAAGGRRGRAPVGRTRKPRG